MVQVMRCEKMYESFNILNENELISIDGGGWLSDFCTVMSMACGVAALCNPATATALGIIAIGYQATAFLADKVGAP